MDQVTLRYGDQALSLTKSAEIIGVKRTEGTGPEALPPEARRLAAPQALPARLGGFELLNVAGAPQPMEEILDGLRASPAISVGTHVFHTSGDGVPFLPTGLLYVECKPDASLEDCQDLLEQLHLEIVEARGEREMLVRVTPESGNPVKTAAALQQSPLIAVAEPELATPGRLHQLVLPTDPRITDQWHLRNTGRHRGTSFGFLTGADARVIEAWERGQTVGSPEVIVAVIDDGFDLSHPDLSGPGKIVAPRDFTRNNTSPTPAFGDWHGTACAGVALGNAQGTGIVGAAPGCRLMPIRWGIDLADREIENWFGHATDQGAWVVSCSWGALARNFPLSTRASRAISRCARDGRNGRGCVVVFAAGNENRDINDPRGGSVNGFAIHPDVMAVSASTSRDRRSNYSNFGAAISACAPSSGAGGHGIATADVMLRYVRNGRIVEGGYTPGAFTNDFGGTSSACPLVAGICALVLSLNPELTAVEVKQLIQSAARRIGDPASYDAQGHSRQFGFGCVNAAAALAGLGREEDRARFWGERGHRATNRFAVDALPREIQEFYRLHLDYIERHSMDADHAKGSDPEERPRHFIDIDEYGEFPFVELPEDYGKAVGKFGAEIVIGRGIVPWQIEDTYDELVAAFRLKNGDAVLKHSAWLGHYVGDAHVPLHTTENYNGQLTGQKGLHSYFETTLLNRHVFPQDIRPRPAREIREKPHQLAFEWVRESYTYLQPILDADAANGGKTGRRNLRGFAKIAKPIAVDRITKGCSRLASLWLSAWVEAGRPDLQEIADGVRELAAPREAVMASGRR